MKKLFLFFLFFILMSFKLPADGWIYETNNLFYGKDYKISYLDVNPINSDSVGFKFLEKIKKFKVNSQTEIFDYYLTIDTVGNFYLYYLKNTNGIWSITDSILLKLKFGQNYEFKGFIDTIIRKNNRYFKKYKESDLVLICDTLEFPNKILVEFSDNDTIWYLYSELTGIIFNDKFIFKISNLNENYPQVKKNYFKIRFSYKNKKFSIFETDSIYLKDINSDFKLFKTGELLPLSLKWNKTDDLNLKLLIYNENLKLIDSLNIYENSIFINDFYNFRKIKLIFFAENNDVEFRDTLIAYSTNKLYKVLDSLDFYKKQIDSLNYIIINTKDTILNIYLNDELILSTKMNNLDNNIDFTNIFIDVDEFLIATDLNANHVIKYNGMNKINILKDFSNYKYIIVLFFKNNKLIGKYKILNM